MSTLLSLKKRRRRKPQGNQRLDIQGLRTIAVLLVVLSHLFGWPRGGFIGVDVFFVISGFLITGSLVHTLEKTGRISFRSFYQRRIRRIVPAATLVLVLTCIASFAIFSQTRYESTFLDALWAFLFVANWRFGLEGTDYFTASGPVSPLQHYWSLSVEEQFYFVWPLIIAAIGLLAMRQSWERRRRVATMAAAMTVIATASFIYAILDTFSNPTWAYFSTLTRVWELGTGALLAIAIDSLRRIPDRFRTSIAWSGLLVIAVGAFFIAEDGGLFPGPLAIVPVTGTALIIAAGTKEGNTAPYILTNPVSTYIGDISYSLYLWHWPVIILLGSLMDPDPYYYAAAILLMFGGSIAAYHFFEDPIRKSNWLLSDSERKDRKVLDFTAWRIPSLSVSERQQTRGIVALALVTVGLVAFAIQPPTPASSPPIRSATAAAATVPDKADGPSDASYSDQLASKINSAVNAVEWPELSPTMESVIEGPQTPPDIVPCGAVKRPDSSKCTWGATDAEHSIVLVGDSIGMTYTQPLKNFALQSGGKWKFQSYAMFDCRFVDINFKAASNAVAEACPERKEEAIDTIIEEKPDLVIIANAYSSTDPGEWRAGMQRYLERFQDHTEHIVFLSAPPAGKHPADCFTRSSSPADCLSQIPDTWYMRAEVEQQLAQSVDGTFIDSRSWFCTPDGYCPSFVGTLPVRMDTVHMSPAYADYISPALKAAVESIQISP
ncbi:acyltransferase [Rhodococcus pyridinivorans]|uniref:acyltransferase family protein n=1 Tax=Rhodococcus pyridinivorans TaxID=103816 RepID=UPI00200AE6E9|nr:acyltransferase family protein [Rhodococcus pyridinivorans]UPW06023.1 acyltransferase [Rhodococcus pyridinivorans]